MGLENENFTAREIMNIYEEAVQEVGNKEIDIFEFVRLNYSYIINNARVEYIDFLKTLKNDYAGALVQLSLLH